MWSLTVTVDSTPIISRMTSMRTLVRVLAWILLIGLVVLTVVPASDRPVTGIQHDLEHFLAFALVACLFAVGYPTRPLGLALCGTAFTLMIELIQIPLPTRHARLEDFVFDTLAAWIGIGLIHLSQKIHNSRRPKPNE
jgi:VanZ family protein